MFPLNQKNLKLSAVLAGAVFLSFVLVDSVGAATSCCLYYQGASASSQCKVLNVSNGATELTEDPKLQKFSCVAYNTAANEVKLSGINPIILSTDPNDLDWVVPLNFVGTYLTDDSAVGIDKVTKCVPVAGYSFKLKSPSDDKLCSLEFKEPVFNNLLTVAVAAQDAKEQQELAQLIKDVESDVNKMCCFPKSHRYLLSSPNDLFNKFIYKPQIKAKIKAPWGISVNSPQACKTDFDQKINEGVALLAPSLTCDQSPDGTLTTEPYWVAMQDCNNLADLATRFIVGYYDSINSEKVNTDKIVVLKTTFGKMFTNVPSANNGNSAKVTSMLNAEAVAVADSDLYNFCLLGPEKYQAQINKGLELEIPDVSGLNKLGSTDINIIVGRVIKMLMGIMGSIALASFVYSGIMWMTAAGNSAKEDKSKMMLVWTAFGVVAVFGSYAVLNFVFEIVK